jgi:dihydrofolate reductase
MKVVLYMQMSINGYVASENDDTSWISKTLWENYKQEVANAGVIICGRKTYELALSEGNLFLEEALNVVMTNDHDIKSENEKVLILHKTNPKEVIEILEKKGFKKIIVGGGGTINSAFMKENLVDEILLDIEPVVFGKGIQLFFPEDFCAKLTLFEIKKLGDNLIQLRYQVEK